MKKRRALLAAERRASGRSSVGRDRCPQPLAAQRRTSAAGDGRSGSSSAAGAPAARAPVLELLRRSTRSSSRSRCQSAKAGYCVAGAGRATGSTRAQRLVQRAQLGHDHALGPVVAHDVVGDEMQDVVLGVQAQQPHAHQRPAARSNGTAAFSAARRPSVGLVVGPRLDGEREIARGSNHLNRLPSRTSKRVRSDSWRPSSPARACSKIGDVQRAAQPQRPGHVGDDVAFAGLVDEPEPLLGVGAARGGAWVPGRRRRAGRGGLVARECVFQAARPGSTASARSTNSDSESSTP